MILGSETILLSTFGLSSTYLNDERRRVASYTPPYVVPHTYMKEYLVPSCGGASYIIVMVRKDIGNRPPICA